MRRVAELDCRYSFKTLEYLTRTSRFMSIQTKSMDEGKSRGEAVPPTSLWAVRLQGHRRDLIPAPSRKEAEAASLLLNAAFSRLPTHTESPMHAFADGWPWGLMEHRAEAHVLGDLLARALLVQWGIHADEPSHQS
jgi:hypothetical protein